MKVFFYPMSSVFRKSVLFRKVSRLGLSVLQVRVTLR